MSIPGEEDVDPVELIVFGSDRDNARDEGEVNTGTSVMNDNGGSCGAFDEDIDVDGVEAAVEAAAVAAAGVAVQGDMENISGSSSSSSIMRVVPPV